MMSSNWNIFRVSGHLCENSAVTKASDAAEYWCFNFLGRRLNQQLSKQWRRRLFDTISHSLWRHYNDNELCDDIIELIAW